jgi:hypothetical protein
MYYDGSEGHLVTITSTDENAFVMGVVQAAGFWEVWAGGYQVPSTEPAATAGWTWLNGEGSFSGFNNSPGSYSDWIGGEPNDGINGTGSEQFLGLKPGGWNDEGWVGHISGYVVEFDPSTISSGGLVPGYVVDDALAAYGASAVPQEPPSAVPEPTTIISGALMLLPFGASTLRMLRKNRK